PLAQDRQLCDVADAKQADLVAEIARAADRNLADLGDDVADLQTCPLGCRSRLNLGNECACLLTGQTHRLGELWRQILGHDAKLSSPNLTEFHELVHHVTDHVGRNSKADADIAAAWTDDGGIDADQFASQVDQCAAGIAGIDRRVGLDEVFVPLDAEAGAAQSAHDAGSDGLTEPERIADGHHEVADFEPFGVAKRQGSEILGRYLDNGYVRVGVSTDPRGLETAAVGERHRDLIGMLNHVIVGDDETLLRINDHARSGGAYLPFGRKLGEVEEAAKKGIVEEWILLLCDAPLDCNVDHARSHFLDERGERWATV